MYISAPLHFAAGAAIAVRFDISIDWADIDLPYETMDIKITIARIMAFFMTPSRLNSYRN